jgi:hypothetical protein
MSGAKVDVELSPPRRDFLLLTREQEEEKRKEGKKSIVSSLSALTKRITLACRKRKDFRVSEGAKSIRDISSPKRFSVTLRKKSRCIVSSQTAREKFKRDAIVSPET